jgi:ketosteroid isomerase-like protein
MDSNKAIIKRFYTSFQNKDYAAMQKCYHSEARFNDPVFRDLSSAEVKAMWQMLITSGKDLKVIYSDVEGEGTTGKCQWQAWYTLSTTGKKVHNIISASFEFKDGLIFRHTDQFDFWRWSKMALGISGTLLGWSPFLLNKVRGTAQERLKKFMEKNPGSIK